MWWIFFQTFKEELDEIGLSIVDAYAFVQYLNEVKEGYISSLSFFFLRKILFLNIKIHGTYKNVYIDLISKFLSSFFEI